MRNLCHTYIGSEKKQKQHILQVLALNYAIKHDSVLENAKKLLCTQVCANY